MAQSVIRGTLGFGSGHHLRVVGPRPASSGSAPSSLLEILSPSAPPACAHALSLSNKYILKVFFKNIKINHEETLASERRWDHLLREPQRQAAWEAVPAHWTPALCALERSPQVASSALVTRPGCANLAWLTYCERTAPNAVA